MKKEQEIFKKRNKENLIKYGEKSKREIKEYEQNVEISIQKKVSRINIKQIIN